MQLSYPGPARNTPYRSLVAVDGALALQAPSGLLLDQPPFARGPRRRGGTTTFGNHRGRRQELSESLDDGLAIAWLIPIHADRENDLARAREACRQLRQ